MSIKKVFLMATCLQLNFSSTLSCEEIESLTIEVVKGNEVVPYLNDLAQLRLSFSRRSLSL